MVNTFIFLMCYKICQKIPEDGVDELRNVSKLQLKVISLQIVCIKCW